MRINIRMMSSVRSVVLLLGLVSPLLANAQSDSDNRIIADTFAVRKFHDAHGVTVSPSVAWIDPTTRTCTLTVENRGDSAVTAKISTEFVVLKPDKSTGVLTEIPVQNPEPNAPSLVPWLRGLEKSITVGPRSSKKVIVKLAALPAFSKAAGVSGAAQGNYKEYRARVVFTVTVPPWRVPLLTRMISDGLEGLVVQYVAGAGEINQPLVSTAILIYRKSRESITSRSEKEARVAIERVETTVSFMDGIKVCATLQHTGDLSVWGTLRAMAKLPNGADSLMSSTPIWLTDTITHACLGVSVFGYPAGTYPVQITFAGDRTDIPVELRSTIQQVSATTTAVVSPSIAALAPATPTVTAPRDGVPVHEILLPGGLRTQPTATLLQSLLAREAQIAAKDSQIVLVEVGAEWCGPCKAFLKTLNDPLMKAALTGVRLVRIDFDWWGPAFMGGSLSLPKALPALFTLRSDGAPATVFNTKLWEEPAQTENGLNARSIAPSLQTFLLEQRKAQGFVASTSMNNDSRRMSPLEE